MRQGEEVAAKASVVLVAVLFGISGPAALAAEDEGPAGYWSVSGGGQPGTGASDAPAPLRVPTPGMSDRPARPSAANEAQSAEFVSPQTRRIVTSLTLGDSIFRANHDVLSNPRLLNETLNGGRLSLNLSIEAREYQGQS